MSYQNDIINQTEPIYSKGKNVLKKLVTYIFIGGLLLSPLNGIFEYLFSIGYFPTFTDIIEAKIEIFFYQSLYVKLIKDVFVVVVFFLLFFFLLRKILKFRSIKVSFSLIVISLSIIYFIILSLIIAIDNDIPLIGIIAGIRSIYVIIFMFVGYFILNDYSVFLAVGRTLTVVGIISSLLGIVQLFLFKYPLFVGRKIFDLPVRLFSTFSTPLTFGSVLCVGLYFVLFYREYRPLFKFITFLLFTINIILTGSGTAIILYAIVFLSFSLSKITNFYLKTGVFIFVSIALFFSVVYLPYLSGRPDVFHSFIDRVNIFLNEIVTQSIETIFFGCGLGIGANVTRALVLRGEINTSTFIADSTFTFLVSQFGLISAIFFYSLNVYLSLLLLNLKKYDIAILLVIFILLSIPAIIFELYPINWVYFWFLGYCMKVIENKMIIYKNYRRK